MCLVKYFNFSKKLKNLIKKQTKYNCKTTLKKSNEIEKNEQNDNIILF